MPRKSYATVAELIEVLESPLTSEFDSFMYTKQAVILLLKEVKGINEEKKEWTKQSNTNQPSTTS